MVRVLIVLNDGNQGGVAKSVLPLLKDPGDIVFSLVCGSEGRFVEELRSMGREVKVINFNRPHFDRSVLSELRTMIRMKHAQVVHAHHPRAYLRTRVAAWLEGVPHISTPHVALLDEVDAEHVSWWRAKYMLLREQLTARMDMVTIALSAANRQRLIEQGISADRVLVIPNGVDLTKFAPGDGMHIRHLLGWNLKDFIVGAVGRLSPEKSLTDLLNAFAKLPSQSSQGGHNYLLIVGDGPERKNLEGLCCSLGLCDRTMFAGFQHEVKQYLDAMDVVCITSIRETLPFALLEAMAMEKPVVAVDIPAFSEILGKGGGLIVNRERLHKGIVQIMADPAYARELGIRARQIVAEQYDEANVLSEMRQLYHLVAAA